MNLDYKRGLKTGFIVYLIGISLVILTHLVLGFDGAHSPPTSFVVVLALVILGIFRLVTNLSRIITGKSVEKSKGELLIHVIFLVLVAACVLWLFVTQG